MPVGSAPASRGVNAGADDNSGATKSLSPPPAYAMTDAVGAPSTPSLPHLATSPPPPPGTSGTPLHPSNPPAASISEPAAMQAAGTNSGAPDALLIRSKVTFSDEELTESSGDDTSTKDQDTAVRGHRAAKRPRADTPPAAKVPSKRSRTAKPEAESKAVTTNVGTRSPPPAQSSTKKNERRLGDDMDISDPAESEDEDGGGDEDEVMGEIDDQFRGSEKATSPPRGRSVGKGKTAANKTPSLHTPRAIVHLGKDIPVTYEPLGDPLEEDELFELDWFAPVHTTAPQGKPSRKGKTKSMAPVSGVSSPVSQTTRRWHRFTAPWMALNPEAPGEVELSDETFCFPFNAEVIKRFNSLGAFLIGQTIGRARSEFSPSRRGTSKRVYPSSSSYSDSIFKY